MFIDLAVGLEVAGVTQGDQVLSIERVAAITNRQDVMNL